MADDDLMAPKPGAPQNWADATRMLKKSIASGVDADVFADPLAPKEKSKPLDYLGHFANDDVAAQGHNSGAKQIGKREAGGGSIAKQGYRMIPGNASTPYVAKKLRQEIETANAKTNRYGGPIPSFGFGPPMAKPDAAPLRKLSRERKMAAPKAKGPLTSKSKKR